MRESERLQGLCRAGTHISTLTSFSDSKERTLEMNTAIETTDEFERLPVTQEAPGFES